MEAIPTPVFRPFHKLRPQGVAFHIATNRVEVVIILYGERFEAALIDVSRSRGVPVCMPTLCVS